jgi:hypothetical protein
MEEELFNDRYIFYYDESNNIRKLILKDNSYNIDSDPSQKSSKNFILAGLVHKGNKCIDVKREDLLKKLHIPLSINEIKFKSIAKGDFFDVLKSKKLKSFLEYINDKELYIHYFNLNMEYWSFIDIIDDIFLYVSKNPNSELEFIFRNSNSTPEELNFLYKNYLHTLIKIDRKKFIESVVKFNYPNINKNTSNEFLSSLNNIIIDNIKNNKSISTLEIEELENLSFLFSRSIGIDDFFLVYSGEKDTILDGLYHFYFDKVKKFYNSTHVFDNEHNVSDKMKIFVKTSNYSFVDSKNEFLVQLSDIISGVLYRYFTFIERKCFLDGYEYNFNEIQTNNLKLIKSLIVKSDEECADFFLSVTSLKERYFHLDFLMNERFPKFISKVIL